MQVKDILHYYLPHNLQAKKNETALQKVKEICRNNTYLLDEPEIKEIIAAWQNDIDLFNKYTK